MPACNKAQDGRWTAFIKHFGQLLCTHTHIHTHSHTNGAAIGSNLGFSIFAQGHSDCRPEESGIEPADLLISRRPDEPPELQPPPTRSINVTWTTRTASVKWQFFTTSQFHGSALHRLLQVLRRSSAEPVKLDVESIVHVKCAAGLMGSNVSVSAPLYDI